jgi:hypothetical protein
MVQAFGIPRLDGQNFKTAPEILIEVNQKLTASGRTGDDVISIVFEEEMVHVFVKTKT